jgi:hypothetical protein
MVTSKQQVLLSHLQVRLDILCLFPLDLHVANLSK